MAQIGPTNTNKRQSMLLPKGSLVNAGHKRLPTLESRQRPLSVAGITALDSVTLQQRPRAQTNTSNSLPEVSEPSEPSNMATTKSIPKSNLSRLPSTRKPATHSRTLSTIESTTSTATAAATTHSRLPSSLSRTSSTVTRHVRNKSSTVSNGRGPSQLVAPSSTMRPAFSTHQQHFSPRKNTGPKPTSSSIIHSNTSATVPSTSATSTTSPETEIALNQAHLLHLALLHSTTHNLLPNSLASARSSLARAHASAAGHLAAVRDAERESALRANIAALAAWGGSTSSSSGGVGSDGSLGECIAQVSGVLNETLALVDEQGGRVVVQVTGVFGEWAECVSEMWRARDTASRSAGGRGEDVVVVEFIDGLGAEWRREAAEVLRRLKSLKVAIGRVGLPKESSNIGQVVISLRDLLASAVEEVDSAIKIEKLVVDLEEEWVDGQLDGTTGEEAVLPASMAAGLGI